jgi:hypothetical protein
MTSSGSRSGSLDECLGFVGGGGRRYNERWGAVVAVSPVNVLEALFELLCVIEHCIVEVFRYLHARL